jgi:aryl-alcohol dehydrogenase-like predicted oxidoreductase
VANTASDLGILMNNTTIPAQLVLGTMDFGTVVEERRAFDILDRFVERGGLWLDTANCYSFWVDPSGVGGASERVIGEWFRQDPGVRGAVKVATKVRQNPLVPHQWPATAEGLSAKAISDGIAGSLERLGLESVDLLWAHAEDRSVDLAETVEAFGRLIADGTVGQLGAANHPSWRVERGRALALAAGVEPWTALQLRHSLVQPRPLAVLREAGHRLLTPDDLDLAQSTGMAVWAYTPLMHGGYVREDKPFSEPYDHPGTARTLAVLDEVVAETGATRNQVVLAWLLASGISPIVGGSRVEYVDEALDSLSVELSSDQIARLGSAR